MERVSLLPQRESRLAGMGLVLLMPALLLCAGGILQSLLGTTLLYDAVQAVRIDRVLFNPLVLLGALALAFFLNCAPVFSARFQEGCLIGSIRLRGRTLNLAVLASISFLAATIFVYLLAENLGVFS